MTKKRMHPRIVGISVHTTVRRERDAGGVNIADYGTVLGADEARGIQRAR